VFGNELVQIVEQNGGVSFTERCGNSLLERMPKDRVGLIGQQVILTQLWPAHPREKRDDDRPARRSASVLKDCFQPRERTPRRRVALLLRHCGDDAAQLGVEVFDTAEHDVQIRAGRREARAGCFVQDAVRRFTNCRVESEEQRLERPVWFEQLGGVRAGEVDANRDVGRTRRKLAQPSRQPRHVHDSQRLSPRPQGRNQLLSRAALQRAINLLFH
jgi:hypothetical protein